jgi:hypothetical protein
MESDFESRGKEVHMVEWSDFGMAEYTERLIFDKGKFFLRIEGDGTTTKTLTPEKAEEWYKKRFPSSSWKKILKQIQARKE